MRPDPVKAGNLWKPAFPGIKQDCLGGFHPMCRQHVQGMMLGRQQIRPATACRSGEWRRELDHHRPCTALLVVNIGCELGLLAFR